MPDLRVHAPAPATLEDSSYCCPLIAYTGDPHVLRLPSEVQATLTVQLQLPRAAVVDHGQERCPLRYTGDPNVLRPPDPPEAQATLTVQLQLPGQ